MEQHDASSLNHQQLDELLQRGKNGDEAALGRLLDQFRPDLKQRARRSLAGAVLARIDESDVIQQTCLSVVRQIDQFEGNQVGQFAAWLHQIHEHNLLNLVRAHKGAAKRAVDREVHGSAPLHGAEGRVSSPSQRAIRKERQVVLEDVLRQLPEHQAQVIRMRYLENASLNEIAQQLERSEQAVAGLLKRGIAQLRRTLSDDWSV